MAKAEWGKKRQCQGCGAAFYDLRKKPILCPKCGAEFDPEAHVKTRRSRPAPAAAPVPVPAKKPLDEEIEVEDIEIETDADEADDEDALIGPDLADEEGEDVSGVVGVKVEGGD